MSDELNQPQQQQQNQRRPQQYYNQPNHYRQNNRQQQQQQQQHSYNNDQQQRRYSNQRYSDNNNKGDKIKDEESTKLSDAKNYKKQTSTASSIDTFSHSNKNCVCCLHHLSTFVTYSCMHYICFTCAIKLRLICEKLECPTCRQQSDNVICTKDSLSTDVENEASNKFSALIKDYQKKKPLNGGFYYNLDRIQYEYDELMSHCCKLCKANNYFYTFDDLDQHMKRHHQLFYCDLCTLNLKMFTFERKYYNRAQLAQHRREGDVDDQSFKGHPNCSYCDERFFDRDELYRHLRIDHCYCNFCDADGHEEYYENYIKLREHLRKDHFLCEIDDCGHKDGSREYSAFRSEIDFNAHKKLRHAKTKSEAKNFGKINIEFNVSNPTRDRIRDRERGDRERGGNRGNQYTNNSYQQQQQQPAANNNYQQQQQAASSITASTQSLIIDENSHGSNSSRSNEGESRRREKLKPVKQPASLRDLYEKFEGSQEPSITPKPTPAPVEIIEEIKPSVVVPIPPPVNSSTIINEAALPSTWRNLISNGPVPKMNLEAEFPSLFNEKGASSLASLGDVIAKQGSVWTKKTPPATKTAEKKENKKSSKTKTNTDNTTVTSHQSRNKVDSKIVELKEPEPRNTSRETFQVLNKKFEDEEDFSEIGTKKKDKKAKNKNVNKIKVDEVKPEVVEIPPTITSVPMSSIINMNSSTLPPPGFAKPAKLETIQPYTKVDNKIVESKEPEPRETSRETFQVLNKKFEDEEDFSEIGTKKKDKKAKNKNVNKIKFDEVKPEMSVTPTPMSSIINTNSPTLPPPGFAKTAMLEANIFESSKPLVVAKNPPPGFTQTSQPQPETFKYIKAQNYDQRNNELTLQLISLLDGAQFNLFKTFSIDYHTEKLNARSYLEKCKNLFSNESEKSKNFLDLLQEMIILLPDIRLQNQLYDEYLILLQQTAEKPQKIDGKVKLAWAEKQKSQQANVPVNRLSNCITCNQLLGNNEVNLHVKLAHSSSSSINNGAKKSEPDDEFPDLPLSSSVIFNNPQESLSLLNKKKSRRKFVQ
jgi:hypothetical protein